MRRIGERPAIGAIDIAAAPQASIDVDPRIARNFEHLYDLHAAQVAAWARRLGGPRLDVEDVVQEVFVVLHRKLSTLRDHDQLGAWLFRLTAHQVDHQRRSRRWRRLFHLGDVEELSTASAEPSAPELLERHEAEGQLHRCLDKLKERYRVPLVMFEIEGLPCEQIAELLGISVPAVWTRIHRARIQLLERLRREGRQA